MKKKIFFTDLDETLLTREKNMTPATVDVITKLTEKGHYVALTSGRPLDSVMEARRLLPISDQGLFYIANNGSQIVNAKTLEKIREVRMTMEEVLYLFQAAEENGITDEQAAKEIVKKHRVSNFEAMEALQEINKNLGAGIALEYDKGVFFYRKSKQPTQKKEPEESTAVRLAKKLGSRGMSKKERMAIIAHYTR